MKLSNIFKKENKATKAKIQPLEKNQLSKVIGGDGDPNTDLLKDKKNPTMHPSASQNSQTL